MSERIQNSLRSAATALLALSLSISAEAQPLAAPKTDAKAALDWLALVDAGKFEATWVEAARSFQKAQSKVDWAKGLGEARPTMGKLVIRTLLNHEVRTTLPNLPPGKYITVRFTTVFEKHANGSESVTVVKDGTRGFRMMSYLLK